MHFEFVFSVLAFTCYGLINTTGEREMDPGTRKCEEEMISVLNKRPCQCLWRYCFLTMQRTALSQSDSLWSIEKRISMFSKEGKQRPVYQKHVPVLNLLLMVSDIFSIYSVKSNIRIWISCQMKIHYFTVYSI